MTPLELSFIGFFLTTGSGVMAHVLTKTSLSKSLSEKLDNELSKIEIAENKVEQEMLIVLTKLADKVDTTSTAVTRIETRLHTYDLIWEKLGEHDEEFKKVGEKMAVVTTICEQLLPTVQKSQG